MLVFLIIPILFCTIKLNMTHFELIRGGNQLSKRFKLVEESFTGVSIYIDQRTGVEYGGYGSTLTPLRNPDGTLFVDESEIDQDYEHKEK